MKLPTFVHPLPRTTVQTGSPRSAAPFKVGIDARTPGRSAPYRLPGTHHGFRKGERTITRSSSRRSSQPPISSATRFLTASFLVVALAVAATAPAANAQADEAQVRVVHASLDAPAVDLFVGGERALEGFTFGTASDRVRLPAGDAEVAVVPAGAAEEDAVISATLPLEAGAADEVAAVGLRADIAAQVCPNDLSPTADGRARVRVIHASPDAGPVDVAVTGGDVLFAGFEFPNAGGYTEVAAGSYDLEVRAAGTETVALPLPGVAFEAGTVYDNFAVGLAADGSVTVLPLTAPASSSGGDDDAAAGVDTEATDSGRGRGGRSGDASQGAVHSMPSVGVGSSIATDTTSNLLLAAAAAAAIAAGFAIRGRLGRSPR